MQHDFVIFVIFEKGSWNKIPIPSCSNRKRDGKDVGFTWKSTRSQFHATPKLTNVDFRARKEKMLISC